MLYREWSISLLLIDFCIVVSITVHQYSKNFRNNSIQIVDEAFQTDFQYAMIAFHSEDRANVEMQMFVDVAFANFDAILVQSSIDQIINVSRIIDFENVKKNASNFQHVILDESVYNSMSNDQKFKSIVLLDEKDFAIFQNVFVNVL